MTTSTAINFPHTSKSLFLNVIRVCMYDDTAIYVARAPFYLVTDYLIELLLPKSRGCLLGARQGARCSGAFRCGIARLLFLLLLMVIPIPMAATLSRITSYTTVSASTQLRFCFGGTAGESSHTSLCVEHPAFPPSCDCPHRWQQDCLE